MTQVLKKPTRGDTLLDLKHTNKEDLVWDAKVRGSLGCSDHEMKEFRILRRQGRQQQHLLDFKRTDSGLFRDLLGRILWDTALERGGVQESWLIFKHHLLQAQAWSMLISRKLSKGGRRMNKGLPARLRCKKEAYMR